MAVNRWPKRATNLLAAVLILQLIEEKRTSDGTAG
jgi:hypothetical protein